jgi:hypothetical protein
VNRSEPAALIAGGIAAAVLFVPFTLTHGPTSYNLEREVLGWDMHRWGLLMGTIPEVLIGVGLWRLRGLLAGARRVTAGALAVVCATMFLFAAMNLALGAIGPPFDLFLLVPATAVAAATTARHGATRALLVLLAATYCAALAIALVPQQVSDAVDGYRIFGLVVNVGVGVLWAVLGMYIILTTRGPRAAAG